MEMSDQVMQREEESFDMTSEHSPLPMDADAAATSPSSLVDVEGDSDVGVSYDPIKTESSKNLTPTHQTKKNLYLKLDEILITALHDNFEVYHGSTVDRIIMVDFLSSVVIKHIPSCPDLQKIMCLRDTVLTARVKRAFPEVEYRRKQIRQDHFRKAWLYVNIRMKVKPKKEKAESKLKGHKSSVTTSGTWTPEVSAPIDSEHLKRRHTPQHAQQSHSSRHSTRKINKDPAVARLSQKQKSHSNLNKLPEPMSPKEGGVAADQSVSIVTGYNSQERSAVVMDNYTITQWVKSHYEEDHTSYVPVQDVVKTFRQSFGLDITYKECHQMIYSAFTSPRQRTCPLKTVRVSSMGAQYVYRGIAPSKRQGDEQVPEHKFPDDPSPEPAVSISDSLQDEREEIWRKLAEELKIERDKAISERNQALSVLMDVEQEYAQAISVIDRLQKERQLRRDAPRSNHRDTRGDALIHRDSIEHRELLTPTDHRDPRGELLSPRHFPRVSESSASKAESNMLSALAPTCEQCSSGRAGYEHLKAEREQIWRNIVEQTQLERDEARQRLEVVKKERDCYLERLHGYEKENQRLRDSVAVHAGTGSPSKETTRPLPPNVHALNATGLGTSSTARNGGKEALDTVLLRLRSKRKQSTPTKFSKSPRLSADTVTPPGFVDSGRLTPDDVTSGQDDQAPDVVPVDSAERDLHTNGSSDPHEMLLYFEGSDMIAFRPHPMED